MPSSLDKVWSTVLVSALLAAALLLVLLGARLWVAEERVSLYRERAELAKGMAQQAMRYAALQERLDVNCRAALLKVLDRVGIDDGPAWVLAGGSPPPGGVGGE